MHQFMPISIWKRLLSQGFRTITSYCPEPLSNVRMCWLAMPLGAGFLRWVLARRTIEQKNESEFYLFLAVARL